MPPALRKDSSAKKPSAPLPPRSMGTRRTPGTSPAPTSGPPTSMITPSRRPSVHDEEDGPKVVETPTPASRTGAHAPNAGTGIADLEPLTSDSGETAGQVPFKEAGVASKDSATSGGVGAAGNAAAPVDQNEPAINQAHRPKSPSPPSLPYSTLVAAAASKFHGENAATSDTISGTSDGTNDKGKQRETNTSPFLVPVGTVPPPRSRSATATVEELDYERVGPPSPAKPPGMEVDAPAAQSNTAAEPGKETEAESRAYGPSATDEEASGQVNTKSSQSAQEAAAFFDAALAAVEANGPPDIHLGDVNAVDGDPIDVDAIADAPVSSIDVDSFEPDDDIPDLQNGTPALDEDTIDPDGELMAEDMSNEEFANLKKAMALSRLEALNKKDRDGTSSSSRRPDASGGSPPKRARVNSQGDASPPNHGEEIPEGRMLRPRNEDGTVISPGRSTGGSKHTAPTYAAVAATGASAAKSSNTGNAPLHPQPGAHGGSAPQPAPAHHAAHAAAAPNPAFHAAPCAAAPDPVLITVTPNSASTVAALNPAPAAVAANPALGPAALNPAAAAAPNPALGAAINGVGQAGLAAPIAGGQAVQPGAAAPFQIVVAGPHYLRRYSPVVASTTADGHPPSLYSTPIPAGGWHRVTGATKESVEQTAAATGTLALWDASELTDGLGIYAHKHAGSNNISDVDLLKGLIVRHLNLEAMGLTVNVGCVLAANPNDTLFFVNNLPPHLIAALLAQGVLSAEGHSFDFSGRSPEPVLYLGAIEQLRYEDSDQGARDALAKIRDSLDGDDFFIRALLSRRDALPAHVPPQEARRALLDTLQVHPITFTTGAGANAVQSLQWRVYMHPPTHNEQALASIVAVFQNVTVATFQSVGYASATRHYCRMCRSIDHPTGLCPIPLAPGYAGPSIADVIARFAALNNSNNNRGRGRGRGGASQGGNRGGNRGGGRGNANTNGRGRGFFVGRGRGRGN
ncbi:hypothetical protein B0H16DRAFT_1619709 [Mycena metata]|uniref:Uncharacterized protein n=1 Tax=Mycena metata TaxID=1033252 RepID=A0AAD7MEX2_9AGAR|nr:hypothetical protein B0H16DRAFT_1619709 [Mycena metata]